MNKYEYWEKFVAHNPAMKREQVTLKTSIIRSIVFQSFDKAQEKRKPMVEPEVVNDIMGFFNKGVKK